MSESVSQSVSQSDQIKSCTNSEKETYHNTNEGVVFSVDEHKNQCSNLVPHSYVHPLLR